MSNFIAEQKTIQQTAEEQAMTRTRENSKYRLASYSEAAHELDCIIEKSYRRKAVLGVMLVVGLGVAGLGFIALTHASNQIVAVLKEQGEK